MDLNGLLSKVCVVIFKRFEEWKWVNLEVKFVSDLIDMIDFKLSLIEKKQNYQIIFYVESNFKLYLDELDIFYKKYLNE